MAFRKSDKQNLKIIGLWIFRSIYEDSLYQIYNSWTFYAIMKQACLISWFSLQNLNILTCLASRNLSSKIINRHRYIRKDYFGLNFAFIITFNHMHDQKLFVSLILLLVISKTINKSKRLWFFTSENSLILSGSIISPTRLYVLLTL